MTDRHDVAILGGGLAGLTLALQLRRRFDGIRVLVLERRAHPVPVAAHKIGESTVEIGAHYFADTLGLREHLDREHIRKFGFRFFFSDRRAGIDDVTELGVRRVLPTPAWQIDRGIFENFLGRTAREVGVDFLDEATVREVSIADDGGPHRVAYEYLGELRSARSTWMIDAGGRVGLLKRRFGLARENAHHVHSVWFRIDDRLAIDEWCEDASWRGQCDPPERWRSTNHLVGPGYWVWLIPLSSGAHSVGIVADSRMHPLESMNTFEGALGWLHEHQPTLAQQVAARRDRLLDFAFLRKFSHGCSRVFSADRWAITGEAGVFLDPFYSPGSDFIAISNTYITELIARDRNGAALAPHVRLYERMYFSFYENTLSLYQDQYPLFGDAEVMPLKVLWDYAYYWGVLCQLVFQRRLTDAALFADLGRELQQAQDMNRRMQALLREWQESRAPRNPAVLLDQGRLPWFAELNRGLHDDLDDAGVRARLRENVVLLERLGAAIAARAGADWTWTPGESSCDPLLWDAA